MIFRAMRINPHIFGAKVICGCALCNYKEMLNDVTHYKLFHIKTGKEYYLNINETKGLIEFVEKY